MSRLSRLVSRCIWLLAGVSEQITGILRPTSRLPIGEEFQWDCPLSPDGVCHYYSHDGIVHLNDGTFDQMPRSYDPTYETEDSCIYCGKPLERK
jgi:hypothetical protein